jgi:hypothetical protein
MDSRFAVRVIDRSHVISSNSSIGSHVRKIAGAAGRSGMASTDRVGWAEKERGRQADQGYLTIADMC